METIELKKDLLEPQKSKPVIIYGTLVFIVVYALILKKVLVSSSTFSFLDWCLVVLYPMMCLLYILRGFGFTFKNKFGKAFVLIDNEQIAIKPKAFKNGQSIRWDDIESLGLKRSKLLVQTKSGKISTIDMSDLDYSLKVNIKKNIMTIADSKSIAVTFQ